MNISLDLIRQWAAELDAFRDDEDTFADTLDGQTDFLDALDQMLRQDATDAGLIEGLKAAEAQMSARRKRIEARKDATRRFIAKVLDAAGMKKAERPIATVSLRPGNVSVHITNEDDVPRQLCAVKHTPDKKAIKAQIEAGETVPGAELVTGDPILTVRAS